MHGIMNPGVKIRQKMDKSRICVNIDDDIAGKTSSECMRNS